MSPPLRLFASSGLLVLAALQLACATGGTLSSDPATVSKGIADRAGVDPAGWPARERGSLPPGVSASDELTIQEAVAIALWNNPPFQLTLTDLGVARAELVDANLLRNPVLSILLPWGPKQLEATANWAIDSIWQRPRRVAAARLDVDAVAARLVQDGLVLMGTVRTAYIQAASAARRAQLTREIADVVGTFGNVIESQFKAGEISELDARATRDERLIAEANARAAEHDRTLALVRLRAAVGLPQETALTLTPLQNLQALPCGDQDALLKDALAARPDVRAAELAVEAAGARAGLARAQAVAITAILDANAEGKEGFERGPGFSAELPIFSQNTGGKARAQAALLQAQARYLVVRARVDEEVHTASAMLARARDVLTLWEGEIAQSVAIEQRQAQLAYEAGELPLFNVIDASRRAVTIRIGGLDARRELLNAAAALDQAIGRSCALR